MNQQYTILTFAIIILTVVLFLSCDKKTVTEPENGEDPEPFIPKELTFSEPFSIPVETSYPALLAVTDVDLNGLPDLLVANVSGSLYLTVISNPGGEVPVQQNIRLPAVSDITAGDFTANGYPDVIVPTGISDGSWYILSNDGTGSFSIAREEQLDTNRASIISSAAGHFNQNGNLDISFLTSSRYPMGLHMYNNLGDLEFKHELFKEIGFAFEHTAYDITGNGFDDIVVYSDWFSSLYLIVNNGDGTFQDGRLIDLEGDVMAWRWRI